MNSRIALGTAQFGLAYGVANKTGQVSPREIATILTLARATGMRTIDTAIAYGDSEQRLGESGVTEWQVVTKLPPTPAACADVRGWVMDSAARSLERLRISRLHALLLHRSQDLTGPRGAALYDALLQLKQAGCVAKIGVSIYSPDDLEPLFGRFVLDLVQAPFNVIDRRLAASGWLARLADARVEVHVRSIFLQGILLMQQAERPGMFERWRPVWERWRAWLEATRLTAVQGCVGFALSDARIDRVVLGVDNCRQLQEILQCTSLQVHAPEALASNDEDLINPSRWKLS